MPEQNRPLDKVVLAQQSWPDSPGVCAHPGPPHGLHPATQQTLCPLFSMPATPLLQVVPDVAHGDAHCIANTCVVRKREGRHKRPQANASSGWTLNRGHLRI